MLRWSKLLPIVLLAAGALFAQASRDLKRVPAVYEPLTGHQRWLRYRDEAFLSPGLYLASLGAAAGGQLANDPPEWKQGLKGYARRSASTFGVFTVQTTIRESMAAAMHYDPRYRPCSCTGVWRRSVHALKWTLLTSNDESRTRVDIPYLAGAYGSGMISIFWYPHRFEPLSDGVRIGSQQAAFGAGGNLYREFTPEFKRLYRRSTARFRRP